MRKKLLSLVVTLVTLFVGSSSVSAYDWTGNEMETGKEFYLYNVGFKSFLAASGDMVANPEAASKWVISEGERGYSIASGNRNLYFNLIPDCGVGNYSAGWENVVGELFVSYAMGITQSSTRSDAYKFSYDYSRDRIDLRYFNIQANNADFTPAETAGPCNDWLLITQDQVDEYAKELEAWEGSEVAPGQYYLYNIYTGMYLKGNSELADIDNADLYSISNGTFGTYRISLNGQYLQQKKGAPSYSKNGVNWTFDYHPQGYRIHSLTAGETEARFFNANNNSNNNGEYVNYPKRNSVAEIQRTYWILVSVEEYNIRKSLTITIPESGYTTYSNKLTGVKLVDSHYTAYASTGVENENLYFTSIAAMPTPEGALVKGEPGTWRLARAKNAAANEVNYLKAGDNAAHPGAYVLASATGFPLGFYALNNTVTVPEGKAYLEVPGASAKGFALDAANIEQATAISTVIAEDNTTDAYSVMGTKVGNNYKGIVIKNGKKFFQK